MAFGSRLVIIEPEVSFKNVEDLMRLHQEANDKSVVAYRSWTQLWFLLVKAGLEPIKGNFIHPETMIDYLRGSAKDKRMNNYVTVWRKT